MSTITLTPELKQMHAYWRLFVSFANAIQTILLDPHLAPELQLERIQEQLERVQPYLQSLPRTVRTELDADPAVQAVLADVAQRLKQASSGGDRPYYVRREDGELHEVTNVLEPGARPLSDTEILALLQEDGKA